MILYVLYTGMATKKKSTDGGSSSQAVLKVAKAPGQGVRLTSQSRKIVESIRKFFEKEKACRSTINRMAIVKRTAEATGLSERTVRNIHKESVASDGQLLTPVKRYTVSRIRINPDSMYNSNLPVAHCELNPIELAWASVKGYIARHNTQYTLQEVQRLTPEGFAHTTADMWRNFCRHVVKVEEDYMAKDGIMEDIIDEMTLTITPDSDDDSDDEDLIDEDDRQVIDRVLQQSETDRDTTICTNPRRDLTETIQHLDPNFVEAVLPLT